MQEMGSCRGVPQQSKIYDRSQAPGTGELLGIMWPVQRQGSGVAQFGGRQWMQRSQLELRSTQRCRHV